jgi:extracellular elastinolytic metalloproteinase
VGNEASSVYHEYTHGLSNRLVVDADGVSTLNGPQAGAMGEAWSDWYAYDYLESVGLERDTAKPGELVIFEYSTAGANTIRTQPLDCTVGAPAAVCPGTPTSGPGGYTYGDLGHISRRGPEVHADGEIWAETLWDLRTKLGTRLTESLVTRAMELSPADPSYLDMRNSILQADLVVAHGAHQKDIWKVFAKRGMGFFAATIDGSDTQPVEDFTLPPSPSAPRGTLTGTVTDKGSGQPVAGAAVAFGGHSSGFAGSYAAVTDASGRYQIKNIFTGTYQKVSARAAGYEPVVRTVTVRKGANSANWVIRRDLASTTAGASIVAVNGDDASEFGCGPTAAFDMSQGTGWSTDAQITSGTAIDPRFVTVKLAATVNVVEIGINPTGNCGDDPSSSTGDYRVETSPDGSTWAVAASGHFGVANRNKMNAVPLNAGSTGGVRFIRYTMLGTQVADEGGTCPGGLTGCQFVDTVEVGVFDALS